METRGYLVGSGVKRTTTAILFSILVSSIFTAVLLSNSITSSAESSASVNTSSTNAYSDFNGDGFDDLAIGVYLELIDSTISQAGAVNVLYGSSSGLRASPFGTTPDDQFWNQDSTGVEDTAEAIDNFGFSLAAGDFNNDGFGDLAIGAPGEDIDGVPNGGAVHVLYGSASGLQTTSPLDQFWTQNSPGVEDFVRFNDKFGSSLAADDFNNDGFADLAVGVPREDIGTAKTAGGVNVLYGSSSGLQATGTGGPNDQFWHQNSPGVLNTAENGDGFGGSLATGDFNNDGFGDLAIAVTVFTGSGAFSEDIGTAQDAGAVNVLYGSPSGLQATGTGGPNDQFWHQGTPGVEDVEEETDYFGWSLVAGDFNNDGFDDLAIGVFLESVDAIPQVGAVNVLYGSSSGLQTSSPADQFWNQNSPGVEDTAEDADGFGWSLVAGDFNNDGFDDLAIGARYENTAIIIHAGVVNVLYGSSSGLQTSSPADQFWNQNSPGVNDSAERDDLFGTSLAAGDFNGDGKEDLAVGAPGESLGDVTMAGAVNVLYGSSSGLQTSSPADQFWTQNSPGVEDDPEGDSFGSSLA